MQSKRRSPGKGRAFEARVRPRAGGTDRNRLDGALSGRAGRAVAHPIWRRRAASRQGER